MASFSKSHGDVNGVVNVDIQDAGQTSVGVPISLAGPKLDFFSIDLGANISSQLGTGGAIEAVINCIQQKATVYIYQATGNDNQVLSVAVYPTAAWTTSDLYDAIQALGTVNTFNLGSIDSVENNGLNLENYC